SRLIATDSRRKLTMRIQTEAMRHLVSKYLNLNERKLGYSMTQTWTVTI
ncbi:TonB-denpendent receptor, partial [Salmonella enterica subsp. enterica serovar Agona]|nr:TonB-denpendent receptor [Salmonella enterica subsp. enterica serovar Agona]